MTTTLQGFTQELKDWGIAISSGLTLGIPLLYTMEAWWEGAYLKLWHIIIFLILIFLLNLILNYSVGFKKETTLNETMSQALNTMAASLVASFLILAVLGRITFSTQIGDITGIVLLEAVPISIGASLGNEIIRRRGESRKGSEKQNKKDPSDVVTAKDILSTIVGIVFVGTAIAVTQEVPMLAAGMTYWHHIATIILTALIITMIIYLTEFDREDNNPSEKGFVGTMPRSILMVYTTVTIVSLIQLFIFGRITFDTPIHWIASQVIVLSLPSAVGGAAGKLMV